MVKILLGNEMITQFVGNFYIMVNGYLYLYLIR